MGPQPLVEVIRMAQLLLLDTDLLVDYSRRRSEAIQYLRALSRRATISAITVAELYAGVRDGHERTDLDQLVTQTLVIDVDARIAERAGLISRQFRANHGTGFADAVIAATAEIERATLVTLNARHFPMLTDVIVPYTKS